MEDEYQFDDAFADFDVDVAVANAQKNQKASQSPSISNPYTSKRPVNQTTTEQHPDKKVPAIKKSGAIDTYLHAKPVTNDASTADFNNAVTKTLNKYFGHSKFRRGQLEILDAIINGKQDAAVFWSTGSGKSMCYMIPPLYLKKVAIVISPLISLMQDQVAKLNGLGNEESVTENDIAAFLGSGQKDYGVEERALNGEYKIVYCTPEKLSSGNFLDRLANLHLQNSICLIAIDESHCVSEWGHDFRKDYRLIGDRIRNHHVLKRIPIVALTATAVPRVQSDIIKSLHLRSPKIVQQSFDRDNLIIKVKRKPDGGYKIALKGFVDHMLKLDAQKKRESTIIYCPTQNLVEELTFWLDTRLQDSNVKVQSYHGGQTMGHRQDAHVNFLTGRTSVIVATLAFGMGIDKIDTRRILHWGPPKTVEEYYQQIGRAGRDGIESYCTMYCNSNDFERYKDDFYLGGLSASVRANQEASIDSLKKFAMSEEVCRRAEILKFFHETPSFGARCGTCDTCISRRENGDDFERDFADSGARLVLHIISCITPSQGLTTINKIILGQEVESYRLAFSVQNNQPGFLDMVKEMKSSMQGYKKRLPSSYFTKDLLPALVDKGYVQMSSHTSNSGGYKRTWSGYSLTLKGRQHLSNGTIILPVPSSVRQYELEHKAKMEKSLQEMRKRGGIDVDKIPKQELEEGDGVVLKAFKIWCNYLDTLERLGRNERLQELEDLRLRIDSWRMDVASQYRITPSDAMPDHQLFSIAYLAATLKNQKIEKDSLIAIGLRSRNIEDLLVTINGWIEETKPPESYEESKLKSIDSAMSLPETFQPKSAWEFFSYKPNKKTGMATWESSYNRFMSGACVHAIAMNPSNGRPIQAQTVVGHIFDGSLAGRNINMKKLSQYSKPPTKSEWERLQQAEIETSLDVTGDPKTSGINGESFRMTDFLVPIMGELFASKDFKERTDEEKDKFAYWCNLLKWYSVLKRLGFEPSFEDSIVDV